MSSGPADGVVDKHLIHHQYRNLFVLGSGSFTTYYPGQPYAYAVGPLAVRLPTRRFRRRET
jgi:choline dehydrogenase-like flavoprotein